jgi:predicted TIM-barrel fold metal-dependent hydrolase
MRDGFRIFDAHTHLGVARHSGRRFNSDQMLAWMDASGIDRALVIPFPVVEDCRAAHEEIGAAVRAWPDRLVGAACLPPWQFREAEFRDEVRRTVERFGFRALKLQPQYHGLNPISPRSDFFFETAVEFGLTLICHTGAGAPFALPSLFILPARRFPELRLVLAHSGGGLYSAEAIVAATVCPNVYLELSTLLPHQVAEVLAHVPASRTMIGSDLPENAGTEIGKILALEIAEEARREILFNTAARLFGA